jgi:hypothetical protein
MSKRELLLQAIGVMPDTAVDVLYAVWSISKWNNNEPNAETMADKNDLEKGYQILIKNKKKIDPPLDEIKEKLDYLDKTQHEMIT